MIRFELKTFDQEEAREIVKLACRISDRVFLDNDDECKVDAKDFLGVTYASTFSKVFVSSTSEEILRIFLKYTKL